MDQDSAYTREQVREFEIVGQSVPRVEGYDKVTGRAEYTDDIDLHGMTYAKVYCSPVAHGII